MYVGQRLMSSVSCNGVVVILLAVYQSINHSIIECPHSKTGARTQMIQCGTNTNGTHGQALGGSYV